MSVDDFACLLGISKQSVYNLIKSNQPLKKKYFLKIKHLLSDDEITQMYSPSVILGNSLIVNSPNSTISKHHLTLARDDEPKIQSTFSINYYNNLTDFSNNSNVLTKTYDLQTLRIITNNKPVFDYSKIVLCRDNDITYICNIVNIVPTDKPTLCMIENKIDADNTTRFIASVRRDVLTNKIMLTIEGQQEMIIPTTCTVIGVVICRIC